MLLYKNFIQVRENPNSDDIEIYFFDYSQDYETKAYQVSFDDFSITRNKENPFYYNYDLNLFVIQEKGRKGKVKKSIEDRSSLYAVLKKIRAFKDKIKKLVDKINSYSSQIKAFREDLYEVLTSVTVLCDVVEAVLKLQEEGFNLLITPISSTKDLINKYSDLAVTLIENASSSIANAKNTFFDLARFPLEQANKVVKSLNNAKLTLCTNKNDLGLIEEDRDELVKSWYELTNQTCKINAFGKRAESVTELTLENEQGQTFTVRNMLETQVLPNESIEDLSIRLYGDSSYSWVILFFNDLTELNSLKKSTSICYPVSDISVISGNPIYDKTHTDNLGTDLNSVLDIEENDFKKVVGIDNVLQAINLRLNTLKGSARYKSEYGLTSLNNRTVGEVKNEIAETLLSDIRVLSVNNIDVYFNSDVTSYSVSFTLINNDQKTIKGSF